MRTSLLLLAACGLSEDAFRDDQARLTCERKERCPDAASGSNCSAAEPAPRSELFACTYNEDAAASCLEAIPEAECEGSSVAFPSACAEVYTDCDPI